MIGFLLRTTPRRPRSGPILPMDEVDRQFWKLRAERDAARQQEERHK